LIKEKEQVAEVRARHRADHGRGPRLCGGDHGYLYWGY
jgi:hypothetical protein